MTKTQEHITIDELIPDDVNFNQGTEYGNNLIEKSLRRLGAGRSILIDKNNRIIAGNKTIEGCANVGLNKVVVIETDGTEIVAVRRKDIDLDSKLGRELALADNSTAKNDISFDEELIKAKADEFGIDASEWGVDIDFDFNDDEEDEEDDEEIDIDVKDELFPSDNEYKVPSLLKERQAGRLELPLTPWGANSRLSKDVATYHFYVDDYRFNKLFSDPSKLIASGCKNIVEPNCSLHDQTPIAFGLHLIYKKRWIARYCQECGMNVYVDLNVSHKFIEYNKLGIPKGYNAFATRGLDGWMESLKSDLEVAREISGLETPNLLVYGGGKEIKSFCQKNNLLYVTDFINAKKK